MNEQDDPVLSYRVSYSQRVRDELLRLSESARISGNGTRFLTALKEVDRRLRIYPQFGQPLADLQFESLQIWIGVVPPLVVRYILDESRKLVLIGIPLKTLPNSGF